MAVGSENTPGKCTWSAMFLAGLVGCAGGAKPTFEFHPGSDFQGIADETIDLLAQPCTITAPVSPALGHLDVTVNANETVYLTKVADGSYLVNGSFANGNPCSAPATYAVNIAHSGAG